MFCSFRFYLTLFFPHSNNSHAIKVLLMATTNNEFVYPSLLHPQSRRTTYTHHVSDSATNLWPTITRTLPPTLTPAIDLFCGRDVLSAAISQSDGERQQRSQPAAAPHERRDVRNYNYTGNKKGTIFISNRNLFIFFHL